MTNIKTVKADKSPKRQMDPRLCKPGKQVRRLGPVETQEKKTSVLIITMHFNDKLCTSLNIKYVLCIPISLIVSKAGSTYLQTAD